MVSQQIIDIIIKAQDQASATANKVDASLQKIGKTSSLISRVPGFDTMRTKISSVATTLDGKLGGALSKARNGFNTLRTSISNAGSSLRNKLGSAVDGVRNKLSSFTNGARSAASGLSFLKGAASMTMGLIGFELVSAFIEAGRASINAASQLDYFGQRLGLSGEESAKFRSELDDMQKEFRKVDMTAVGATAEELSVKLDLPKEKLSELTEMTAVMSSAFIKEGRTQEDAILAVGDALDGQFRRLQEIGITQADLMANGWSGDLQDKAGLIDAINKSLEKKGFAQTAKDITNLDDAFAALSVAGGQLLQKLLVPLTPALLSITTAVLGVMDQIGEFIKSMQTAWTNLPDWAKIGIGIAAVAVAIGVVVGALGGLGAAAGTLFGPLITLAGLIMGISWPVVAVVAAIGLLAVAIFEVGKLFGWWTDLGSMFDAIRAGVMRLWSAFINHPDVQAAIQAIKDAFNWLKDAIFGAWNGLKKFFVESTGGKFDIVRALIDGVGQAWNNMKPYILMVIGAIQTLIGWVLAFAASDPIGQVVNAWNGFYDTVNNIIQGVLEFLGLWSGGDFDIVTAVMEGIAAAWDLISEPLMAYLSIFQTIFTVIWEVLNGHMSLQTGLMTIWSSLATNIPVILMGLFNIFVTVWGAIFNYVYIIASRIVLAVWTWLSQLPGKVWALLLQVLARIISAGAMWVNKARAAATQIVSGIISYLSQLPGRALSALLGVVSSIVSAGAQWVSNAKQKASELVSGAVDTISQLPGRISSALSGVVDAIVAPFRQAYDTAKSIWDSIANLASGIGARGGDLPPINSTTTVNSNDLISAENIITTENVVHEHTGSMDININLRGLPENVSAREVAEIIDETVLSNQFTKKFAENSNFQKWDAKMKLKISRANSRARGV